MGYRLQGSEGTPPEKNIREYPRVGGGLDWQGWLLLQDFERFVEGTNEIKKNEWTN